MDSYRNVVNCNRHIITHYIEVRYRVSTCKYNNYFSFTKRNKVFVVINFRLFSSYILFLPDFVFDYFRLLGRAEKVYYNLNNFKLGYSRIRLINTRYPRSKCNRTSVILNICERHSFFAYQSKHI